MRAQSGLVVLACMVALAGHTGRALATSVVLSGDLGNANFSAPPGTLGIGQSVSVPFLQNFAGRGDVGGTVIAANTGSAFNITITNLVFQAQDWSPMHMTFVRLNVGQVFASLPGQFGAAQSLSGVAQSNLGGGVISGNTMLHGSVFLPTVSYGLSSTNMEFFNVGPTFAAVNVGVQGILIEMQLDMTIFGDGFINLPSSFESTTTPAPAVGMVLGLAGLCAARRRRA
ncbi:MAG: hypothetical protein ACKVS8_07360 [Phycisphaerales bacterium]